MTAILRRWARPAFGRPALGRGVPGRGLPGRGLPGWGLLDWCAVVGYPLLMIAAIRSDQRDADGLRVLWPTVVMAVPAALLGRRRLSALFLTTAGAIAVLLTLGPGDVLFGPRLAVVLAVGAVAAARRAAVGVGAAAAAFVALVAAEIAWRAVDLAGSLPHRIAVAAGATLITFTAQVLAVGLMIGLLVRQRRQHASSMRARAAAQAIVGERLRIARELHDSVAHSIGLIALQAGAANRVFDTQPARARQAIGVVETASREVLAELRRMLVTLRASDADDAAATGLADLPRLASATTAAGVRVDVRWLGTPGPLPAEIDRSAFRIIQEAVTNVVRHADTDSCQVTLEHADDALAIEVLDDGPGRAGPAGSPGHGLVGMRERVALLHGDFFAGPRAEGGFRVAARLPMPVVAT